MLGEDDSRGFISAGLGGIAAEHPEREPFAVVAGPATAAQFNTIRSTVFPLACFRAEDLNFAFDSSFVEFSLRREMPRLKRLLDRHPRSPLSVFGHADPVGNDEYNKSLSGRRAQAIYALLTRREDLWEDLHQRGDWKTQHIQS